MVDFLKDIKGFFGLSEYNFYEKFLTQLLQTANSVPIQSLWLVYMEVGPFMGVKMGQPLIDDLNEVEDGNAGANTGAIAVKKTSEKFKDTPCAIFAQGVQIPGESISIQRDWPPNSGFLKPIVSNGRAEPQPLGISFLETNSSLVDYYLRPWIINISIRGIKEVEALGADQLKTDISVIHFNKTKFGLKTRKAWRFKDAYPISIDQEDYSYSGDNVILRQTQFAYDRYYFEEIDSVGDSIFSTIGDIPIAGNFLKTGLERVTAPINSQVVALQSKFSVQNLEAVASDLIFGTGARIATNVSGAVGEAIDQTINGALSNVREGQSDFVNSVSEQAEDSVDALTNARESRNDDTPQYENSSVGDSTVSAAQTLQLKSSLERAQRKNKVDVVKIKDGDTPVFTGVTEPTKPKEGLNSAVEGIRDSIKDENAAAEQTASPDNIGPATDDVRDSLVNKIPFQLVKINPDDATNNAQVSQDRGATAVGVAGSGGDDVPNGLNVPTQNNPVPDDDAIGESRQISRQYVGIAKNDSSAKNITTQEVVVESTDSIKSAKGIPYTHVVIDADDGKPSKTAGFQQANVDPNDGEAGKVVPTQKVTIEPNDRIERE